ncbi:MAG TPA: hypothetical protein VKX16_10415 [Chloroflexota bacterium]|nr:hypothetical protein [Chloroflexota bacterium]
MDYSGVGSDLVRCPSCAGTGKIPGTGAEYAPDCQRCGGTGMIDRVDPAMDSDESVRPQDEGMF